MWMENPFRSWKDSDLYKMLNLEGERIPYLVKNKDKSLGSAKSHPMHMAITNFLDAMDVLVHRGRPINWNPRQFPAAVQRKIFAETKRRQMIGLLRPKPVTVKRKQKRPLK